MIPDRDYPDWEDHVALIDGDPEPRPLVALCLKCFATNPAGTFRFDNEPVEIGGRTVTAREWRLEGFQARHRTGAPRYRLSCRRCGFVTSHVAETA